jgi:hypothetical protein
MKAVYAGKPLEIGPRDLPMDDPAAESFDEVRRECRY